MNLNTEYNSLYTYSTSIDDQQIHWQQQHTDTLDSALRTYHPSHTCLPKTNAPLRHTIASQSSFKHIYKDNEKWKCLFSENNIKLVDLLISWPLGVKLFKTDCQQNRPSRTVWQMGILNSVIMVLTNIKLVDFLNSWPSVDISNTVITDIHNDYLSHKFPRNLTVNPQKSVKSVHRGCWLTLPRRVLFLLLLSYIKWLSPWISTHACCFDRA